MCVLWQPSHVQAPNVAYAVLGSTSQGIFNRDNEVVVQVLVRPHLEYYEQFWLPIFKKNPTTLNCNRRDTEMVKKMEILVSSLKVLGYLVRQSIQS